MLRFYIAVLLFSGSFFGASASDASGGSIWYEFIGDSLNPYKYRVFIQMYQNANGLNVGIGPKDLCISSSCFPSTIIQVPLQPLYNNQPPLDSIQGRNPGTILTPWLKECVDTSSGNVAYTEIYLYSTEVILPGKCRDFVFSLSQCCRRNYDNIYGGSNLYLSTTLNNTLGPNTSPKFFSPAAKSFCLNYNFYWNQNAIEPDGDSLFYSLAVPNTGTICGPSINYLFHPGYSVVQPITTHSGISINPKNGELSFSPSQLEIASFNVQVDEYRYISGSWLLISKTDRTLEYSAVASCKSSIINGPLFKTSIYQPMLIDRDSIKGYGIRKVFSVDSILDTVPANHYLLKVPVLAYSCLDSHVTIEFSTGVACQSIASDGSDFRIIGPDSIMRPVVKVRYTCDPTGYTSTIGLELHKPLDRNGNYFLVVKTGKDLNTLISKCGFAMPIGSMAIVRIENCVTPEYDLLNVTVEDDKRVRLVWQGDSTTYYPGFFNSWKVYRGDGTGPYFLIDEVKKHDERQYIDFSLGAPPLDASSFHYKVGLRQNHSDHALTRNIKTILLTVDQPDTNNPQNTIYSWTPYNGWPGPMYKLQIGTTGTIWSGITWKNIKGPDSNFFSHPYSFPEITPGSNNLYAARVVAQNPLDSSSRFISESNWVYLRLAYYYPPAERAPKYYNIPNVFSPNGDAQNDFFTVDSDFENIALSIYNRWGKLIHEQESKVENFSWDGRDMNTGQHLPDGVYYYVAEFSSMLNDGNGGFWVKKEISNGNLTIFTSGSK